MGRAIGVRYVSDNAPILQPQSDTRERNVYVLFVFFVAKNKPILLRQRLRRTGRKQTMKLNEAIRGMEVKSWERRENSNGKCTVYVRFVPKKPAPILSVKEVS